MLDHTLPGIPGGPGGPGGPMMPLYSDPETPKKRPESVAGLGQGPLPSIPKPRGQMAPDQPYLEARRGALHRMFLASQGVPEGQEAQC